MQISAGRWLIVQFTDARVIQCGHIRLVPITENGYLIGNGLQLRQPLSRRVRTARAVRGQLSVWLDHWSTVRLLVAMLGGRRLPLHRPDARLLLQVLGPQPLLVALGADVRLVLVLQMRLVHGVRERAHLAEQLNVVAVQLNLNQLTETDGLFDSDQ